MLLSTPLAGATTVTRVHYDTSAPGPFASADVPDPTGIRDFHVGVAPLPLDAPATTVEATMLDGSTLKTPGRIAFFDAAGEQLDVEDFCYRIDRSVPENTTEIVVYPSPLVRPCPVQGLTYGPATTGQVQFVVD